MFKLLTIVICVFVSVGLLFASSTKEEKAKKGAAESVKLLFWSFGVYGLSYLEQNKEKSEWYINKAIKRFEDENLNIQIEIAFHEGYKGVEMLTAAAMAKQGPDVIALWGGTYTLNLKDGLLPLNDYFTSKEMANIEGWDTHEADGKYYAVPIRTMDTCIWYNKSLFKKVGVVAERDYDGTYESLVNICEKLKKAGITPMVNGGADGWGVSWLGFTMLADEIPTTMQKFIADLASGKKNFSTTDELKKVLKAHQDLVTKGFYNQDLTTINRQEGVTLFAQGKGAMLPSISFDVFGARAGIGDDLGVMKMPALSSDSPNFGAAVGGHGVDSLAVANYSKHPAEAVKFIKFLKSYKEERKFVKETGELPNVKGKYDDVLADPLLVKILKFSPVAPFPDNLMPMSIVDAWFKFLPVLLSGQMTVDEFLKEMDKTRDEVLSSQ